MEEIELENSLDELSASLNSLSNTLEASNAGSVTTSGYSHGSSSSYGRGGVNSVYSSGHSTSTTYDPYRAAQARKIAEAENQARGQQVAHESQVRIDTINQTILRKHTLQPGETYSGLIRVKIPSVHDGGSIIFDVYPGREQHELGFMLSPVR